MPEQSFNKIQNGSLAVGRIVHFYTGDRSKWSNSVDKGPYPAIVTQVGPAGTNPNLKILPPFRTPYDEGSVPEYDPVQAIERYWQWPPRL